MTHKDTVLSMSISDEDTDAGSDFIPLHAAYEDEDEENIELGIDLTPNIDDGYVPLHNEEEEEEVLMPNPTFSTSDSVSSLSASLSFFSSLSSSCAWKSSMFSLLFVSSSSSSSKDT
jgi:hypothetical protein